MPRDDHRSSRRRSPSPRRHSRRSPSPRHSRGEERSEKSLPESFSRDRDDKKGLAEDNRNVLERMDKAFEGGPLEDFNRCISENTKLKVWTRNYKEVRGICTGYLIAFDKHWNLVMRDVDEVFLKPKKAKTPYLWGVEKSDIEAIKEMEPKVPRKKKTPEEKAEAEAAAVAAAAAKKNGETTESEMEVSGAEGATPKSAGDPAKPTKEKKKRRKKKKNKDSVMDKRHVGQLFIRGDNIVMVALLEEEDEDEGGEEEEEGASTAAEA